MADESQKNEGTLVEEWAHVLLDVREFEKDLPYENLLLLEYYQVLAQLVHAFHKDAEDLVQIAIWILREALHVVLALTFLSFPGIFTAPVPVDLLLMVNALSLKYVKEHVVNEVVDMHPQSEVLFRDVLSSWHISEQVDVVAKF